MILTSARQLLRRFRSQTDAVVTVEFAILMPLYFMFLSSTVDLGLVILRQSQLERAVDVVVRDIRLHTAEQRTHDNVRDDICAVSGFIDNCETSLRLEMVRLDPFAWTGVNPKPDCIDKPEEMEPATELPENRQSNELMLIRACMSFKPLFSGWGLGEDIANDEGLVSLVAISAFVQEPR